MSIWSYLGHMDNVLVCKASQTSSWCQHSLEKAGEDHLSIQRVRVAMPYRLVYVSQVWVFCPGFWPLAGTRLSHSDPAWPRWPAWGGSVPCPRGGLGSALPWARCSARATATPGCRGCRRAGAVKQSGLQVLISLPRGLCKNEHGNTQAGQLAVKHQAGRVLCRIFKVSWREMVLKDYCGTVSRHIPYSMDFYYSVKRNNSHLPSQMLPAEFLFLKYLRKVLEASNLSLGS